MKNFAIISDTACDLSKEVLNEYGIEMIKGHYMDMDGSDRVSFTDWSECIGYASGNDFYKALKSNPDKFKTAPPSIPEITEAFEKIASEGKDILAFTISSVMSGTFNLYNTAKAEVLKKYPETVIRVIDTLRFGAGIGLMEINAAMMRDAGKSIDEVGDYMENNKWKFHQMGWLDDLSFVAKKGRITHSKAFFGQLIGIKPLGEGDRNGLTTVLGKAKGEAAAYSAMIEYIKNEIENPEDQVILICHSMREKQAQQYKALIEENFKPKKVYISECGPSCGINIGPGLMSAYFVGRESSQDLVEEKALMEKILTK